MTLADAQYGGVEEKLFIVKIMYIQKNNNIKVITICKQKETFHSEVILTSKQPR